MSKQISVEVDTFKDIQLSSQQELIQIEPKFHRDGMVISSWNTERDGSGIYYDLTSSIQLTDQEKTLYAQWRELYNLLFITKSGNSYDFDTSISDINGNIQYCSSSAPYEPTTPYSDITELQDKTNLIAVNDTKGEISSIGNWAFRDCTSLSSINCDNVISVGYCAFQNCSNLTSINCPNLGIIKTQTFFGCNNLSFVDIPNATLIEHSTFNGCSSLTSINCPNVLSIGDSAFYDCRSIISIDCSNVSSFGDQVFNRCDSLLSVFLLGQNEPPTIKDGTFCGNEVVYVKNETYKKYLTAQHWSGFTDWISSITQPIVSFLSDDTYESLVSEQKLNYGMSAVPPIVVKPYYDFKGWNGNYNDVSSDTSCFAIFSKRFITSYNTVLDMSAHNMSGNDANFTHTCDEINPKVTYTNEEGEESILENSRDYSISYYNNNLSVENLGYGQTVSKTAIVEINGNGYYEGELSTEFIISYTRNISAVSITLNPCGGDIEGHEGPQTIIRNSGDKYYPLPNAIKVGSSFEGWLLDDVGIIDENSIVDTYSAHTLSAQWNIETYTLTYQCSHMISTDNPISYVMGNSIIFNAPEMEKGYTFNGWSPDKITAEDYGDKNIVGNSSPTIYTITYILDGGTTENPTSYTIETESFDLTDASKTGHTFKGWVDEDGNDITRIDTSLCENRVITAVFEPIELDMIYHTNWSSGDFILKTNNNEYKFNATDSSINRNLQYISTSSYIPTTPYSDITELQNKNNLIEVNDTKGEISSIGNYAFYDCTSLSSINCPNVQNIGQGAFYDCSSLKSVIISSMTEDKLTTLGGTMVFDVISGQRGWPVSVYIPLGFTEKLMTETNTWAELVVNRTIQLVEVS